MSDTSNVDDVVDHVLTMQQKYDFRVDADCVRDAVVSSAELLNLSLEESEIVEASDRLLDAMS